ncbi:MAG: hypothetical protein R2854_25185 [Caldilineaceae bacterium]
MEEGLRAPVYATSLTRGLVEVKLRENKLLGEAQLNTIEDDDVVEAGVFTVEFFHTTHSFPLTASASASTRRWDGSSTPATIALTRRPWTTSPRKRTSSSAGATKA